MQELKQTLPRRGLPTVLIKNAILCTILRHTTWYHLSILIPFIYFHFLHAAILPQPTIKKKKKDHTIPEWFPQIWGVNAGHCLSDPNTNTGTTQALGRAHHGLWGPVTSSPSSNPSSLLLDGGLVRSTSPAFRLSTLVLFFRDFLVASCLRHVTWDTILSADAPIDQ